MKESILVFRFNTIPNMNSMDHLPAMFNDLLINKVKLIRTNIDHRGLQTQNSTAIAMTSLAIIASFHPAAITQFHIIVNNPQTYLPPACWIPYRLLFCMNVVMPFCQISPISLTLQYCQLPTNMKTAIVKPMLNIFLRNI